MTSEVEMQSFAKLEDREPCIASPQGQESVLVTTPLTAQTETRSEHRPTWDQKNNPIEFLTTSLGYMSSVSLVIRTPYMIYRHGGVVFLVQYLLALLIFGVPILLLQMYIGQFTSRGILSCWEMFPLFTGVGYAMLIICAIMASYYAMFTAWSVYYMFASWKTTLPWLACDHAWNTDQCWTPTDYTAYNSDNNYTDAYNYYSYSDFSPKKSPSVEYWWNEVLRFGDHVKSPLWWIAFPLLGTWIVVALVLLFGPKVYGKVAYVTTLFPFALASVLFLRFVSLPGALNGINYLLFPDSAHFLNFRSWLNAVIAVFYDMGVAVGPIITLASYNKFRNDLVRDAFLLPMALFVLSVGFSMLVFALLGFLAENRGLAMNDVVNSGPELLYSTMLDGMAFIPQSNLWSSMFHVMVATLSLSTLLAMAETIITAVLDLIPRLHRVRFLVVGCVCCILFALGLPYTLPIGCALFHAMDSAISYNMALVGLAEVVCVSFMYSIFSYVFTNRAFLRFKDDMGLMFGGKGCHCLPWCICWPVVALKWCIVVPLILCAIWWYGLSNGVHLDLQDFVLSDRVKSFYYFIMQLPELALFITPIVVLCLQSFKAKRLSIGLEYLIRPSRCWGPALPENREGMSKYLPENKFDADPLHRV